MDASDRDVRAWARETGWTDRNGRGVSAKGAVGGPAREAYSAAHNGQVPPDYPPGMTEADFDLASATLPDDLDDMAEAVPRPPTPKVTPRSTGNRLAATFKRGTSKGTGKGGKTKPRESTSELIGSVWRIASKIAQPLPPMYRVLRLQSVIVGPLGDDAIKGTMVDPFLQPLARLSKAGKTFSAMAGPPMAIGAMAYHLNQTNGEPNPIVMQACQEMLRHGLMAMMDVGGEAFAAQLAKEKDDEQRYGGDVDMIMAWILAEPADPAAEEANIAAMAARFAGQEMPEPEPQPAA